MARASALRCSVAAACILATATPPAMAAAPAAPLTISVGQTKEFSRIEFRWSGATRAVMRMEDGKAIIRFGRDAQPDLSLLRVSPPKWLKTAEARHVNGALEVVLTLTDDAQARLGQADGVTYVNLAARPDAPAPLVASADATTSQALSAPKQNTTPAGGMVKVVAKPSGEQMQLRFDWKAPAALAVFRRGEAIWVVFDADAKLDVSGLPLKAPQYTKVESLRGPGWSALRIAAPQGMSASAFADRASWTISLGKEVQAPAAITLTRDAESSGPGLTAAVAGAREAIWIQDPVIGDRLGAVPALGPAKGLAKPSTFLELTLLQSWQGLGIESPVTDLAANVEGDLVRIARPNGLALSPRSAAARSQVATGPRPAEMPGLIDPAWAAPEGEFRERYYALMEGSWRESEPGGKSPTTARMGLARFLIGNDLHHEAIGVLNATLKDHPNLASDAEFRALRGIARASIGRMTEALTDFSAAALAGDASSAQWRGYIAAQESRWDDAAEAFAQGASAEARFTPIWRARFARAAAEASLNIGDHATASRYIGLGLNDQAPPEERLHVRLIQARLFAATGDIDRAVRVFDVLGKAPDQSVAAPAMMHSVGLKLGNGKVTPAEAVSAYDSLRFRWRGDATELEIIRALGELHISQGHYRQALETFIGARSIPSNDPAAVQIQAQSSQVFRTLFLDGAADGLQPIQALGLFQDFRDLTPLGPDGDLMVRRIAQRMIDVDLLPQAAELLKYQVDERLEGVPKAQVATTLATVYLMNRQPEQALNAINASRTTILPTAMNLERRRLTARALIGLGRMDDSAEILTGDNSGEAQDIRADIAWKTAAWNAAGPLFEKRLGERWKNPAPLTPDEEGKLLRAGVAFSLAGDDTSIARLRDRYQAYFDKAARPDALRVIFSEATTSPLRLADFGRAAADSASFEGWVAKMKAQLRAPLKSAAPTRQAAAPAIPAAAPTAKQTAAADTAGQG